jgi:hypothetical protein
MSKERRPRDYWNKQTVKNIYYKTKEELGRKPTCHELPQSALNTITRGKYDPNIRTWNGFLEDIGEETRNEWCRETIIEAFYEKKRTLGRNPTSGESYLLSAAIRRGKYNPNVRTWNGFLEDIGEEINTSPNKWYPKTIRETFYEQKKRLGRTPRKDEFQSGALDAIKNGKYDPKIRTWNGFLEDIGEEINHDVKKWYRKTIINAFYEKKKELGMPPKAEEIPNGALRAITRGKYDPNIRSWNEFLRDIGEKITRDCNNREDPAERKAKLETILRRYANAGGGD